jgi:FkbM family methyltransferase
VAARPPRIPADGVSRPAELRRLPGRVARRFSRAVAQAAAIPAPQREVWIDVGAHHGEKTLYPAALRPWRTVYAFEPNWDAVGRIVRRRRNFVVLPFAIDVTDGMATFHVTELEDCSSLLEVVEEERRQWIRGEQLAVREQRTVHTMRLDTFLAQMGIERVDFLKIDAQGNDLNVLRSAGARIESVRRVEVEVTVSPHRPYSGQPGKGEVVEFMTANGFSMVDARRQSFDQEENLVFVNQRR